MLEVEYGKYKRKRTNLPTFFASASNEGDPRIKCSQRMCALCLDWQATISVVAFNEEAIGFQHQRSIASTVVAT